MTRRSWRRLGGALGTLALVGLGAAGWAAPAPLPAVPRERTYAIAKGSAAKHAAGEHADGLPGRIRLTVGRQDVLVLRNEDDTAQTVGPVRLEPGQTFRLPFPAPMETSLVCSAHGSGRIVVTAELPPAPGWARLRWRLAELTEG